VGMWPQKQNKIKVQPFNWGEHGLNSRDESAPVGVPCGREEFTERANIQGVLRKGGGKRRKNSEMKRKGERASGKKSSGWKVSKG